MPRCLLPASQSGARPDLDGKYLLKRCFPGYFFARFSWGQLGRRILATQGVTGVVRFGLKVPLVPDAVIADLQMAVAEVPATGGDLGGLDEGKIVEILTGCFKGSIARVRQATRGSDCVSVLIDFLGRSLTLNVTRSSVVACGENTVSVPDSVLRLQLEIR
jgi:transcriptional antiterminator RfaH